MTKARKIFDIAPGDNLIVLGDEGQDIALIKEKVLPGLINRTTQKEPYGWHFHLTLPRSSAGTYLKNTCWTGLMRHRITII